jgi:hypothetical protein
MGDVFGVAVDLSTHRFLLASAFGAVEDLLDNAFGISGICSFGQLTFFLGVFTIQ